MQNDQERIRSKEMGVFGFYVTNVLEIAIWQRVLVDIVEVFQNSLIVSPTISDFAFFAFSGQIFSYLIIIDYESTCWQDKKYRQQEISKWL